MNSLRHMESLAEWERRWKIAEIQFYGSLRLDKREFISATLSRSIPRTGTCPAGPYVSVNKSSSPSPFPRG